MGVSGPATLWGLAEATLFFIVPDVLLTDVAIRKPRLLPAACLAALAGALAGGAAMHAWASAAPASAVAAVGRVPAVSDGTFETARADLRREGLARALAVTFGAVRGVPYKAYAVKAPAERLGLAGFLLLSVPARLVRFALTASAARAVSALILAKVSVTRKRLLFAGGWAVFYAFYFVLMPN